MRDSVNDNNTPRFYGEEIEPGRFKFGENWANFLATLDSKRIENATKHLADMLGHTDLSGMSFLDIGCGSGLFSLSAMRMNARTVHSFDYDPESVRCTQYLREKFFPNTDKWTIERGDVLNSAYIGSLGTYDVVYSWGVLHHTGNMWKALENATMTVSTGDLFIAIYNDQGRMSRFWYIVKKTYVRLPSWAQPLFVAIFLPRFEGPAMVKNILKGKFPWSHFNEYYLSRGMSRWHDIKDWIGGFPFEVAKPEEIFDFFRIKGFTLKRLVTCGGGLGNNEFVFKRIS